MELLVLMAQRNEAYPGEYSPEALDCVTAIGYSDYPEYFDKKKAEAEVSGEFERVVVVRLEVDEAAIMRLLRPVSPVIPATIVDAS